LTLHQNPQKEARRIERNALELFRQAYNNKSAEGFPGVEIQELSNMAQCFKTNIVIYRLIRSEKGERKAHLVFRTHTKFVDTMHLDLYNEHFSLISNLQSYSSTFICQRCTKIFNSTKRLNRHARTCQAAVTLSYPGGIFKLQKTVFDEIEEYLDIQIPQNMRVFPYRICFDFESYFDTNNLPTDTTKISWEARHIPISVSLCSNVPGYKEPKCIIREEFDLDGVPLLTAMLQYILEIQEHSTALLNEKYQYIYSTIWT
jgi:hypothetical protein